MMGLFDEPGDCWACAGYGNVKGDDCWICRGTGNHTEEEDDEEE
jgi:DnaJ-class molecular chaperone